MDKTREPHLPVSAGTPVTPTPSAPPFPPAEARGARDSVDVAALEELLRRVRRGPRTAPADRRPAPVREETTPSAG
ncbi:hypothetical protein SAMN02745673_03299 [Marinactinospora thermotolerans DSM 45154]|uniref:Uncharacterized protein n=1 Tax=Marinactinospora thermotolerans DSM 45154 TaxID=1122192 RepID=A0A1T4S7U5_9ACTN|nr:hypothetical protein [Marinactinospora thermotolerans]SKA24313.1 hypothetical protein SAMN02745673_03299 [Marinactinospora thermotolerans DSM 45154]